MLNWIIGIPLITLFATVGLAIVVIPSTRGEPSRPTLNSLLVLIATWAFSSVMVHSIDFPSTKFWMYILLLCGMFTGSVGVHFSIRFARYSGWKTKWVVRGYYILPVLLSGALFRGQLLTDATLLPGGAVDVQFGPMAPLLWGMVGGGIILAIIFLLSSFHRPFHADKKYTIFPLLGFTVMCFGAISNLFVSLYPIDVAAGLIFVAMISYGVIAGNLLKPSTKQSWPQTISVTLFLLALCYVALFTFCHVWMGFTVVTASILAGLASVILGAVTFVPLRMPLSIAVGRLLFPSIYHYQQALSRLAALDRSLIQWESSSLDALNIIAEATHAEGVVLLLRNEKTKYFEAKHAAGKDIRSMLQIILPIDSPIVAYLDTQDSTLSSEEITQYFNKRILVRVKDDTLQAIGFALCYAIKSFNGPLAILIVKWGPRGARYGDETKDFINLACHQIATNIVNAELYETSKREAIERKRAEEKGREADSLKELDRLRAELLANVSHELRTPLANIKGYSTMMLDYEKQLNIDEKRKYLITIDVATDRLLELIDQLLDMSRLDTGMLVLDKETLNISELFKDIIAEAQVRIKTHHIVLDLAARLPRVNVDAGRIRQVVDNLISNAVKYSDSGSEIVVSVQQVDGELLTKVADHGIGIPGQDLPRVFERMFRSQENQSPGVKGVGLGLAICKGLVEAHGGRIWIESKEGEGTQCFFTIPKM